MTTKPPASWIPPSIVAATENGCVVTIGNFDGVHRGHQTILDDVTTAAAEFGVISLAITFEPHPVTVFRGTPPAEFRISTSDERSAALRMCGIDEVWTVPFSREFASMTADEFIHDVLIDGLQARRVHVGYDFNFGRGRTGTPQMLKATCEARGVQAFIHDAVGDEGGAISSTRVRASIRGGDLEEIEILLGRPLSVGGATASGHGRGKAMGIPTINLYPTDRILPPFGVYATVLVADGARYASISNLGVRPTFGDDERVSLETMVLDEWPADAAPTEVTVELLGFVRGEQKFDDKDALVAQIQRDVADAKAVHAARSDRFELN